APLCHASDPEVRKRFIRGYRWFLNMYRRASERLRTGDREAEFPENCFPPPLAPLEPCPSPAPG
ncbi:MAG: hypothetical protein D6806_08460, partial [Deltaproteobacteria bacterium]